MSLNTDSNHRFRDENKVLSDFFKEVWVICPSCKKMAITKVDFDTKIARLFCVHCGLNKETTTSLKENGAIETAANYYFDAELWLKSPYKNEEFWAYNDKHLNYLEQYISATLREHGDRSHFTLLEKLPKFYHEAKNRESLLKIIEKLRMKK